MHSPNIHQNPKQNESSKNKIIINFVKAFTISGKWINFLPIL